MSFGTGLNFNFNQSNPTTTAAAAPMFNFGSNFGPGVASSTAPISSQPPPQSTLFSGLSNPGTLPSSLPSATVPSSSGFAGFTPSAPAPAPAPAPAYAQPFVPSAATAPGPTLPSASLGPPQQPQPIAPFTLSLGAPATLNLVTPSATTVAVSDTSTAVTTTASNSANVSHMNFRQMQEMVNKWTFDMEMCEREFIQQATRINANDKIVMRDTDKITKLSDFLEDVDKAHATLREGVSYVKSLQNEFLRLVESVEQCLPPPTIMEPQRVALYGLAEGVNSQLQQITEDLKVVVTHVNDINGAKDKSDPIAQILKILNEHTDAFQFVEENCVTVQKAMDDITKVHESFRREHESTMHKLFRQ